MFVDEFTAARQVAAVLLTLSLALLIVAVYIYNELGMPEGYWLAGRSGRLRRRFEDRRERAQERRWERHAAGSQEQPRRLAEARWIADDAEWWRAVADEHEAQLLQNGPARGSRASRARPAPC